MNSKDKAWFPVVYMFVTTGVFSAILLLFGSMTHERVKNNERISFERAVLRVLPLKMIPKTPVEIHRLYTEVIADSDNTSHGALQYLADDSVIAFILPVNGAGFWAPIRGVIGIERDQRTITGVYFYEQNETPGLGGEIVKAFFRDQFIGKRIADMGAPLTFKPVGSELTESSVHAITGATQTSNRVETILNGHLSDWRELTAKE